VQILRKLLVITLGGFYKNYFLVNKCQLMVRPIADRQAID
jgi:hypothetical protein